MWQRLAVLALLSLVAVPSVAQEPTKIVIGTGGVTGVYYPAGGAICRLVNRSQDTHGLRCGAEPTDGSISNIDALRIGDLEFGVAQSDWQFHAFNGTSQFAESGAFDNLRAVFSLHPEPFTVLARANAGITSFEDLAGKRVNVGDLGSGQRGTMEVLMAEMGWTMETFASASELRAADQSQALCDNEFDAMVYTVGHPSAAIQKATKECDAILVDVRNSGTEALISANPFYREATIPGGLYRGNTRDVSTFGVGATLVTSSDVPEEVVYEVVRAVFERLDRFRDLHPAFANLNPSAMVDDGRSAPLHAGAERYYREIGLIQ